MATYTELYDLRTNAALTNKITVALTVAAQSQLAGTPAPLEAKWARQVLANPIAHGQQVINAVLAANKDLTVAQITAAPDASIQTAVNAIVAGLIAGTE